LANIIDNANNLIDLCDEEGKSLQKQLYVETAINAKGQLLNIPVFRWHVHTFHSLSFGELCSLLALTVNTIAFIINLVLALIVNSEKLSGVWTSVWNILSNPNVLGLLVGVVAFWLFFVYVLYDRYGLYE